MDAETKQILDEILKAVKGLEARVAVIEAGGGATTEMTYAKGGRKVSMKEFLIDKEPKDGVQMTLVIGYFMEMFEGMESFNKADIERGFRAAKEKPPANINDKVNMCIKNGHMMEAETKKDSMKAWSLTRSGEQYVQHKFKKNN